jgi:hypothetical protein
MTEAPAGASLRYVGSLPRQELRDALRRARAFDPPLRILAEDVLGADSRIDFVAVDPVGRVVLVLIGDEGEDGEVLTRALANRAWVRPRLRDWLQLGPTLEISANAPVVAAVLCPFFSPATRTAADDLGPEIVQLSSCRSVRSGAVSTVLLERLSAPPPLELAPAPPVASTDPLPSDPAPVFSPSPGPPAPDAPREARAGSQFRSGLSEEDLGLTAEESREFQ